MLGVFVTAFPKKQNKQRRRP